MSNLFSSISPKTTNFHLTIQGIHVCSPAEYIMEGIVSKMYDVYSFGVILLETISGMCGSKSARRQSSIAWVSNYYNIYILYINICMSYLPL